VEVDFEEVPMIQKRLIQVCNEHGVPVITATQMLESMLTHSRPTRAEVADVANAIYDGTDAVMLSGETAAGEHPIAACATMAKIAFKADEELAARSGPDRWVRMRAAGLMQRASTLRRHNLYVDAIGMAVCRIADGLDLKRIVCFTTTGYTAAAIARHRPAAKITAITNTVATQRRCALLWGVHALVSEDFEHIDDLFPRVERLLLEAGMVVMGETVLVVAGTPLRVGGRTNLLKLHTVGEES
jgi:pyruvate kinase